MILNATPSTLATFPLFLSSIIFRYLQIEDA